VTAAAAPVRAAPPRAARAAVAYTFAANGALLGSWVPRIPGVKADLGLSHGTLGIALLAPALGSLVAMPLAGAAAARWGSARATRVALSAYCLTPALIGMAGALPTLWLALLVWGLGFGSLDVVMNAQGVTVEKAYGRPVLSSFHAAWSLGALLGSLAGAAALGVGVSLTQQLLVGGLALLAAGLLGLRALLPDPPGQGEPAPVFARPTGRLLLLGAIAFAGLLVEGATADWSAVFLREVRHVPAASAGIAFAAFSLAMTAGRVVGDRVVHRYGRAPTIRALAWVGALGLAAGLSLPWTAAVVAGYVALGLGLATIVPVVFAAAGDGQATAGPSIAAVSTCGYVGFIVGPAAIGGLADVVGLHAALYVLPLLTGLAAVLAFAADPRPAPTAPRSWAWR